MYRGVFGRAGSGFGRYLGQGPALRALLASVAAALPGCGVEAPSASSLSDSRSVNAGVLGTARAALITNTVLTASGDTFVRQGLPSLNEGADDQLSVQMSSVHRSLLFFDTPAIAAAVGSGTLVSARIDLFVAENGGGWSSGRPISIHALRQESSESAATWACAIDANVQNQQADCATAWNMSANGAESPFAPTPTATATITNGTQGVVSFDVTQDVLTILAGTAPGYGWLLKKVDETVGGVLRFTSREQGPAPRLTLTIDAPSTCTPTAIADTTCDGVDDDCDGDTDEEVPQVETTCGTGACATFGMETCVDGQLQNSCAPGAPAALDSSCDLIDDDCDGAVDEDYAPVVTSCGAGACAATSATSCVLGAVVEDGCEPGEPAALDATCDGLDDDCDGSNDEDFAPQPTTCGVGACAALGASACIDGTLRDTCDPGEPAASDATCNLSDDDCDGAVDEDFAPSNTSCGIGACASSGATSCVLGEVVDACEAGTPAAGDATCDGVDDDCDGNTDEEYTSQTTACGVGACASSGSTSCAQGTIADDCEPGVAALVDTTCDGIDDDCDGTPDEEFAPHCALVSAVTCVDGVQTHSSCVDQNACNGVESCSGAATCVAGTPPELDDGNPCTIDGCDPASGATHVLAIAGTSCAAYSECTSTGQCKSLLPPDPADVAPELRAGRVSLLERVRFMYEAAEPIQTDVTPGAILNRSVAVLRGRVVDTSGQPLPQVAVSVQGHPEYGKTLSRLDGVYDLVVNGGGPLTVRFTRANAVEAQRTVPVRWQAHEALDDIALSARDGAVTPVVFPSSTSVVHSGSDGQDVRGTRRVRVFIPAGTAAMVTDAAGSEAPASLLSLRASEVGVGTIGSTGLPALFPETAAPVVAFDLSADELEAEPRRVELNQAASIYVENFVDLPVGTPLPVGAYDRHGATWIGAAGGRVIEVLGVNESLAQLDVSGSGNPANSEALSDLGISDEELGVIAQQFTSGDEFFRLTVEQLAPFAIGLPFTATEGTGGSPPSLPPQLWPLDDRNLPPAAAMDHVLAQSLPLAGTPFTLTYRSDRVLGDKRGQTISINAMGSSVGSAVLGGLVDVRIAGQRHVFPVTPTAGGHVDFTWDGTDAAGRPLNGWERADIRVGTLSAKSYREPEGSSSSFAHTAATGDLIGEAVEPHVRWADHERLLYTFDSRQTDIGAWAIDEHHQYDPESRVVYRGDGTAFATKSTATIIERFAGVPQPGSNGLHDGDEGLALAARMDSPRSVATGADGSLYIGTRRGVRRVAAGTSVITTVAGGKPSSSCNASLAEGRAVDMCIFARTIDFARNGSLIIADRPTAVGSVDRIRSLNLDTGLISHVAGVRPTSGCANMGDGGPARDAALCDLAAHASAPDGSIYLLDRGSAQNPMALRKISTDGIIDTVGNATWNAVDDSVALAVGPDGSVYIAQPRNVLRILPTGEVKLFAGNLTANGSSGEGGPATMARFGANGPTGVSVDAEGRIHISDNGNSQIRMVDQRGAIRRVAGTSLGSVSGDGGSPLAASLGVGTLRSAFAPDGSMFITAVSNHVVRVVRPKIAGDFEGEALVPAPEGGELYHFSADGRHLSTTLLPGGALLYSFGYDESGLLSSVIDSAGLETLIERDAAGNPTKIRAPLGEETLLDTNGDGYISTFITPDGSEITATYEAGGLLTNLVDENGDEHEYVYDATGRLITP